VTWALEFPLAQIPDSHEEQENFLDCEANLVDYARRTQVWNLGELTVHTARLEDK
jgi:hypothetical protein